MGVKRRGELSAWLERDPLLRCEAALDARCGAGPEAGPIHRAAQMSRIEAEMDAALAAAQASALPGVGRFREHVWAGAADQEKVCVL